jgi:predicted esterase
LVEAPPLASAAAGAPPPGVAAAAAPADAEAAEGDGTAAAGGRSWWCWRDVEPGTRPSRAAEYTGWDASQAAIDAALAEHAPIDGLVGFSQGATAVAMYLAHARAAPGAAPPAPLRFAVVVAGFLPRDKACAELIRATQGGAAMPTLHVGGAADTLVPPERQAALRAAFPGAAAWEHPGAHMMPTCTGAFKAALLEFMAAAAAALE